DILALEKNLDQVIEELKSDLPVGIETFLVSNQPQVVHHSVNEFMEALWEAIAIVLVISLLNLGLRAGLVVATSIPLVLAIVFVTMQIFGIDLQRISLGALIIALGFVPVGFAKSSAGEYTFTLFAVVVIAVLTSWVVAALFTPLIGTMLLS